MSIKVLWRISETIPYKPQCESSIRIKIVFVSVFWVLDTSAYWRTIFFISHPKHMMWVLKRTVSKRRLKEPSQRDGSFEHPKHMF